MPGLSDRVLYHKGWIDTGLPFEKIREHYAVREKTRRCAPDEGFSACIREGMRKEIRGETRGEGRR